MDDSLEVDPYSPELEPSELFEDIAEFLTESNHTDDFGPPLPPMAKWDNTEVLNFISHEVREAEAVNLSHFHSVSGNIFQNLNEYNCNMLSKSPYIGHRIYLAKENYLRAEASIYNIRESFSSVENIEDVFTSEEAEVEFRPAAKKIGRPRVRPFEKISPKRNERLWEFLINLLRQPATCPDLIRWENFSEGTFKFVKSHEVARLWGNRKSNSNMNYEKFSRAMRYYYKAKVLLSVPGKRLVYKFGPYATGWDAVPPIK